MTNEAYLNQVGILSRRIVYHTERLNRMRREADAVRSIRYGRIGGTAGNNDAPYVRMLERIEEYEEELEGENKLYLESSGPGGAGSQHPAGGAAAGPDVSVPGGNVVPVYRGDPVRRQPDGPPLA